MSSDADQLREALLARDALAIQKKANDEEIKTLLEKLQPGVHHTSAAGEVVVISKESSYLGYSLASWLVGKVEKLR